jgi:hypothetical protein
MPVHDALVGTVRGQANPVLLVNPRGGALVKILRDGILWSLDH